MEQKHIGNLKLYHRLEASQEQSIVGTNQPPPRSTNASTHSTATTSSPQHNTSTQNHTSLHNMDNPNKGNHPSVITTSTHVLGNPTTNSTPSGINSPPTNSNHSQHSIPQASGQINTPLGGYQFTPQQINALTQQFVANVNGGFPHMNLDWHSYSQNGYVQLLNQFTYSYSY